MINEICNPDSRVHYFVLIAIFLWEHILGNTKFGSTIGLIFSPFKKEK